MHRRGATLNRVLLGLVGLSLIGFGGILLAEQWSLVPTRWTATAVGAVRSVPWDTEATAWVIGIGGMLISVLAVLWLCHQLPRRRPAGTLWLNRADAGTGRTTCRTSTLNDAIEHRLTALPGVAGAAALVTETAAGVGLDLEVTAGADADVAAIRDTICGPVVDELASAVECPVSRLSLRLELAPENRRVAAAQIHPRQRRSLTDAGR